LCLGVFLDLFLIILSFVFKKTQQGGRLLQNGGQLAMTAARKSTPISNEVTKRKQANK